MYRITFKKNVLCNMCNNYFFFALANTDHNKQGKYLRHLIYSMQLTCTNIMSLICFLVIVVSLKAEPMKIDNELNHNIDNQNH